jgi:tetratricopeptide (TPR) repeat protein
VKKYTHHLLLAFAVLGVFTSSTAAEDTPWKWSGVKRIVAIGDVHGAYDNLIAILERTGLIDEKERWTGGDTHLVQMGDLVDRGPDSRKCMDLLMELEKDARKKGGHVHVLIGNHEAMNIVGILDHTSREEFASYDSRRAREVYERAFGLYVDEQNKEARQEGKVLPPEREIREIFETQYPPGYFGHRLAFSPRGKYGKWIASHNVSILIDDIVFSHGDWSEEISAMGMEMVNQKVRDELAGEASIEEGVTFHLKGPIQYRGLSEVVLTRKAQEDHQAEVDRILANLGGTRLVVGHTTTNGTIEPRFGGKHISIDVGMHRAYMGGHQVALEIALEIEGNAFYAVHPEGKVKLPEYLDETNIFDYLIEVAAVDPGNMNVHIKLADGYLERGDKIRARETIEHLYQTHAELMPFRYHRILGDLYAESGEADNARDQYMAFISGMSNFVGANPDNPHLRNSLARFCVEKNLSLEIAEENIRAALDQQEDNAVFLLTLGRLQLLQQKPADAVRSLEKAVAGDNPGYDSYYYLGLAYLALKDTEKARDAFELAAESDPNRPEAREELSKIGEDRQL